MTNIYQMTNCPHIKASHLKTCVQLYNLVLYNIPSQNTLTTLREVSNRVALTQTYKGIYPKFTHLTPTSEVGKLIISNFIAPSSKGDGY